MAEENVPAPTRTNEQLVPVKARLPIGKSNLLMDLQKMQKNPIFHISVDILQNTNFFSAFTASSDVPSIYIQLFWNTLTMDTKSSIYSFQLDELWFTLDADLLRSALGITPKDSAHPFVAPPTGDLVIDFVNNLGYPEELQFVSKMYVNSLYQPWRTILSMINQCLTGKTSAIKTFFSNVANLKVPTKKPKPHVIPYCRFTKLIICYLGGRHNIHKRPQSPLHITADDYSLDNLKFVPKGELDEVFRMPIPKDLITDVIHEEGGKKKKASSAGKSKQPAHAKQPAPAKQSKPVKEKTYKPTPSKKIRKGKGMKVRKGKRSDHLVNEEDEEDQPASKPQVEDDEYNLQRGIQVSLESFQAPIDGVAIREPDSGIIQKLLEVEGKGKGIVSDEQVAQSLLDLQKPKKKSTTDQYIFQRRTPATQDASTGPSTQPQDDTSANVVHNTPSPVDAETGADTEKSNSEMNTEILYVEEEQLSI
ncbi:hypothetical protein Tco_0474363 [Tanacetum coccineum]